MRHWTLAFCVGLIGCGGGVGSSNGTGTDSATGSTGATATNTTSPTSGTTDATGATSTGTETGASTGPVFDVGAGTTTDTGGGGSCKVVDDMDATGPCRTKAPPNSFEPEVQWDWTAPAEHPYSWVTPRVANLTDDDRNGEIDLCDDPDIVVVSFLGGGADQPGAMHILDGATGAVHLTLADPVHNTCEPAIGDIDGDGLPEIVTCNPFVPGGVGMNLVAFEHDGTRKWDGDHFWTGFPVSFGTAVALADLDNDGDVEVIANDLVADHDGKTLWVKNEATTPHSATAAADLDGDGDLEVVLGKTAYHHDGSPYYSAPVAVGYPQIADLDDDPEPEILITNADGISLLEHTGAVKYQNLKPTGDAGGPNTWNRPATVHDFDGDGLSEYALSSQNHYTVYEQDGSILWSADVEDFTGIAAGTAFDFLGDGVAEAMYADETNMFVYDGTGATLLQVPRTSMTVVEHPVVSDVDNDGSAEIVVVSSYHKDPNMPASPTVQVIRDKDDRWIQARRIWNQHTYHVTNVREDGTIPQNEKPSWTLLNTYRTNAQIEAGSVCKPEG